MPMPVALSEWLLTEASSGTTPTRVADWRPNPLHLTVTYGTGTPASWTSVPAGNGWAVTKAAITANLGSATLGGTKIKSTLDGTRTMTAQLCINRTAAPTVAYDFPVVFGLLADGVAEDFVIFDRVAGNFNMEGRMGGASRVFGNYTAPSAGVKVVTVVVDTTQGTQANRCRVFFDYTQQSVTGCTLGLNETWTINASNRVLTCGYDAPSEPSPDVTYYAIALYAGALTSAQISDTVGALLLNNDADPTIMTIKSTMSDTSRLADTTRLLA